MRRPATLSRCPVAIIWRRAGTKRLVHSAINVSHNTARRRRNKSIRRSFAPSSRALLLRARRLCICAQLAPRVEWLNQVAASPSPAPNYSLSRLIRRRPSHGGTMWRARFFVRAVHAKVWGHARLLVCWQRTTVTSTRPSRNGCSLEYHTRIV